MKDNHIVIIVLGGLTPTRELQETQWIQNVHREHIENSNPMPVTIECDTPIAGSFHP